MASIPRCDSPMQLDDGPAVDEDELQSPSEQAPSPSSQQANQSFGLSDSGSQSARDPADIKRRKRTSPEALAVLSLAFAENPLPNLKKRNELAQRLDMPTRAVQIWFQNRRQKEKKLPPHERVHKDLPTQQQRKSRQLSASQSAAERPAGSKKETSPALSSSDECNNSSNSLQVPSTLLPPVNLQGRHHPVPPQIHRTVSEPVSSAFLRASSAPNSRRPSTGGSDIDSEDDPQRRPRLKRSASSLSLSTDFDTGMATMRETSNDISAHMPSSSPVHQTHSVQKRSSSLAVAAPLLRRHSFTSSWSAKQSENIRPDSDMSQESPPSTSAGAGPADGDHSPGSDARSALQRKRQRMQQEHAHSEHLKHNYNLNLQIPATSPFNQSSDEPSSAASSTGGLSELLLAATTNDTTAPSSSHGSEQETDEEVSVAAKRQGGDQTFSSVDMSPDEEPDRSLEKPVSSVALTAGAGKEQKPASWSDMPRPTIIANDGKHAVKLQENESEEVDLLLSFSASFAA